MTSRAEILAMARKNEITPLEAMEMLRGLEQEQLKVSQTEVPEPSPVPEPVNGPQPQQRPRTSAGNPDFRVAERSGWASVYFYGLRHPVTVPAGLWEELLAEGNLARFRQFLADNKDKFHNKSMNKRS